MSLADMRVDGSQNGILNLSWRIVIALPDSSKETVFTKQIVLFIPGLDDAVRKQDQKIAVFNVDDALPVISPFDNSQDRTALFETFDEMVTSGVSHDQNHRQMAGIDVAKSRVFWFVVAPEQGCEPIR